ncbi:MAG: 2-octaprenyl-6-methoxyphenyl hydroxylase [Motiliproteus sp.]
MAETTPSSDNKLQSHPTDCDIAIVGGGMVGAALALALCQRDAVTSGCTESDRKLSIKVFETFPVPDVAEVTTASTAPVEPLTPSYDARSTALSLGTRHLLERLGVWSTLAPVSTAIDKIQVSDKGHFGATRIDAAKEKVPALGYVTENRSLGKALLTPLLQQSAQASGSATVEFCSPAEVVAAQSVSGGNRIEYEHDGEVRFCTSKLLVIADGGRSGLREQLQIDTDHSPYQQCALIANVSLDRPHQNIAYERFTEEGPMALLPLTDDSQGRARAALVWSVPLEQADELLRCEPSLFLQQLQQRFGYRAGRFVAIGERHSYPLNMMLAREQIRTGIAVLGNAAHALHPIAGQGFNLALRGAMLLAQEILAAHAQQRDIGSLDTLERFYSQLGWDQTKTIGFSDKVTGLFSNDRSDAIVARNLGLLGLELLPPLKHALAESAMGLDMPLARL